MERSPLLLFQVVLLLGAAKNSSSTEPCCTNADSPDGRPPMLVLDYRDNFTWPLGSSTRDAAISKPDTLYKALIRDLPPGHSTDSAMERSPLLLFQVGYLDHSYCYVTSDDRFLVVVLCPRKWICALTNCRQSVAAFVGDMLLLLCGDIESNPGPNADKVLATVLATVQRIEAGQESIRKDLQALKSWQASVDVELKQLAARLRALEIDTETIKKSQSNSSGSPESVLCINDKLKTIESRCDDAENRLRRSNLLFFGIPDVHDENWSSAEKKVIEFCSQNLGISIQPSQIERSHRLGKYNADKCRPIISKFTLFKDKQSVLENGFKLKGSKLAVREDFSLQTRVARKNLRDFAKSKGMPYKLNVDKLRIDNNTYFYDAMSCSVVQSTR